MDDFKIVIRGGCRDRDELNRLVQEFSVYVGKRFVCTAATVEFNGGNAVDVRSAILPDRPEPPEQSGDLGKTGASDEPRPGPAAEVEPPASAFAGDDGPAMGQGVKGSGTD